MSISIVWRGITYWNLPVDRLALEGEQDVALAREERVRRVEPGGVLGDDVPEELLHEGVRLRVGLAEAPLRHVGGEDVPLAMPAVNGFGVTTSTPGLTRSFQPLMCFGLPLRSAEHDDRVPDDAVVALLVPVLVDLPLVDEVVHVVPRVEDHDVGGQAVRDRLRLRVEAPYEAVIVMPVPAASCWNSAMSFVITGFGVEYATRFSVTSFEPFPAWSSHRRLRPPRGRRRSP